MGSFRKEKIDFMTFCRVIKGNIVHGPKNMKIYHIVDRINHLRNPYTAVFLRNSQKKLRQQRIISSSPCAIIFDKNQIINNYLPNVTYIMVRDIEKAFWSFVTYYRRMYNIPVFAITGTCGKTSVKEMITQILRSKYNVEATIKTRNGDHRSLRYLCGITEETDVAVFETPVDHPGLLETNCKYFQPTIGMITNIGVDHLQLCGTVENYIRAKGEILKGLGYKGTLILNADDERTKKIPLDKYKGKLIYFGVNAPADYRASDIRYGIDGMEFTLHHQHFKYQAFVPGYGEHQVYNALSAIAAVHQIGFGISEAVELLRSFKKFSSQLETVTGYNGSIIIDDTWKSNPTSIDASLKVLKKIGADKKKIAVIGSSSWLGEEEADIHKEIGELIADHQIDTLFAYGTFANQIAAGAKGMKGEIFTCPTPDRLKKLLLPLLSQDTAVLLKTCMRDKSIKSIAAMLKDSPK